MSDEDYRLIFTRKLKYYMELNNKTQMDLMKDLDLSSSTVSNWCTGLKLPRMGKIQMLADYFGINKSDLLEEKKEQSNDSYYLNEETRQIAQEAFENPDLRSLFSVARNIEPEELRAHIEFMQRLKRRERGNSDEGC